MIMMLFSVSVLAQKITVKGHVKDANDEPLIGVNVMAVGTNTGVITDIDGNFTIQAPSNGELKVSYIGYKTQNVKVAGKGNLTIVLKEDAEVLDEVVVVGYGTMKKSNLTGAVDQLKTAKIMETRPVSNLAQGLQGQVAGLNITTTTSGGDPTGDMDINIRGYTGVGETKPPLIIVDGVEVTMADFKSINPLDVESISLLKDASSAAIYGMKAANGVLLVMTKRGEDKPLSVSFRYQGKWNQLMNAPEGANSVRFLRLLNYADKSSGGGYSISQDFLDLIDKTAVRPDLYPAVTPHADHPDRWDETYNQRGNTQWYNALLDNVVYSDQYNLSFSGGGKAFNYYVSGGINKSNGMFKYGKDSYTVYTISPKFTFKMNKWLTFRFFGDYSRSLSDKPYGNDIDTGGNWFHAIARIRPYIVAVDPNGVPINMAGSLARAGRETQRDDKLSYQGEVEYNPFKGMTVFIKGGYRENVREYQAVLKSNTTYGPLGLVSTDNKSRISKNTLNTDFYSFNPYGVYSFDLNDHTHNFTVTAGLQFDRTRAKAIDANANLLQTESIPSLGLTYGTKGVKDKITQQTNIGYFGRITYNYKERYLFEVNGRYDGTSQYLKGNRWAFFPSASMGYLISNEPFFKPLERVVNSLKLRASWGMLSTPVETNIFNILDFVSPDDANYYFTGLTESGKQAYVTSPGKIVSSNATWSRPRTIDFGVDLTLFNRFTVVFDWYKRTIDREIGPSKTYPNILGFTPPSTNNTKSQTTGFDLTLTYFGKIGKDITYNLRGTLADYRGEIVAYDNPTYSLGPVLSEYYSGKTQGEIWGYVTDKMAKSESDLTHAPNQSYIYSGALRLGDIIYQDLNGDGIIDRGLSTLDDKGDLAIIGNTTPRYQYSFGGDIEWKGLSVSVFFQGVGKKDWMPATLALKEPPVDNPVYFWGGGTGAFHHAFFKNHYEAIYRPADTPDIEGGPNPDGWLPRIYSSTESLKNQQPQTEYIQNAAYLRLKNITVGYTFPRKLLDKCYVQNLQVSVSCDNVCTFHKMDVDFIDPEVALGNAKIYPMQRVFSVGANITF